MAVLLPASFTLLLILFAVSGGHGHSHGQDKKKSSAGGHSHEHDTVKTTPAADYSNAPITINVTNSVTNEPTKTYGTYVVYRGILLGGMRRLQATDSTFTFTYSENSDYGPFLESVNGLPGSSVNHTYWQLKVKKTDGTVITPDVGIGCYIPSKNDVIILNYTQY